MNHRPIEVGNAIYSMEARVDHRFREPETYNHKILRTMCAMIAPHSIVALMPTSKNLAVVVGILGDYVGMISVPADTTTFPNKDEFRWEQFFVLTKPVPIRDSVWKLLERMNHPR